MLSLSAAAAVPAPLGAQAVAGGPIFDLEGMVIESSPLRGGIDGLSRAWTGMDGEALDRRRAGTIGETLASEPGVAQTYYGPVASRPVIRGLDGQRVRVLHNGLDAFDASSDSVDHAVAADPLLVERVEVLRGSPALLYGTNAIGGVVNAIDRSVPRTVPEGGTEATFRGGYTSVDDGWGAGGVAFAGGGSFAAQVHGVARETSDYDTPTFRLPDGSRVDEVANSHSRTSDVGAGLSYVTDSGFWGMAVARYDARYGVPNEEAPTIDLVRDRLEARGHFTPQAEGWLRELRVRAAYGDYHHDETEVSGEVAATFEREGFEARLEATHAMGRLDGVVGLQGNLDELTVSGEENFFAGASGRNPAVGGEDARRLAVFLIEEIGLGERWKINAGARAEVLEQDFNGARDRDDAGFNGSLGFARQLADGWSLGGNLAYTERLPTAAELLSDGPHLAVGAFEVGNPGLDRERSVGLEASLRRTSGRLTGRLTGHFTWFDDFIFLDGTGRELDADGGDPAVSGEEALAERVYRGVDAEFYGLEVEATWRALEQASHALDLRLFGDLVRARNTTDREDLPRTPPWRAGAAVEWHWKEATLALEVIHTARQDDTAPGEDETAGHTRINAYARHGFSSGGADLEVFVKGANLTDELARVHTSFLRDSAPLPGIGLEVGIGMRF